MLMRVFSEGRTEGKALQPTPKKCLGSNDLAEAERERKSVEGDYRSVERAMDGALQAVGSPLGQVGPGVVRHL